MPISTFTLPPSFKLGSQWFCQRATGAAASKAPSSQSGQRPPDDSRSKACGTVSNAWATTDLRSQATIKCSPPLSSSTTSRQRPRFRAGAHCGLEVISCAEESDVAALAASRKQTQAAKCLRLRGHSSPLCYDVKPSARKLKYLVRR